MAPEMLGAFAGGVVGLSSGLLANSNATLFQIPELTIYTCCGMVPGGLIGLIIDLSLPWNYRILGDYRKLDKLVHKKKTKKV